MQDFSSVNIKNMIIHNVGNKVKGESLEISTEICDANNEVTNQYLKQFFFSTFKFDVTYRFVHETDKSSPNLCVNSSFSYVVLSTLLLSSRDLTEWSLVYHSTLSYQRFYDLHSIHYDHLEGLHQLI